MLDLGVSGGWNDLIKGPVGSKHGGKVLRAVAGRIIVTGLGAGGHPAPSHSSSGCRHIPDLPVKSLRQAEEDLLGAFGGDSLGVQSRDAEAMLEIHPAGVRVSTDM